MYENLKNKKLLVIGSDAYSDSLVRTAQGLGVYVIAADGNPMSERTPAKRSADEYWDINYAEHETIAAKCRENNVDGVISGFGEARVLNACKIARLLGLPYYATEEQILTTSNKAAFKEICRECGVQTPGFIRVDKNSLASGKENAKNLKLPLIVKPVDGGGRKGMTMIDSLDNFEPVVENAIECSASGEAIVEEFITGNEFSARYTISGGKAVLSALKEKYMSLESPDIRLTDIEITPSSNLRRFIDEVDGPLQKYFEKLGIKNGVEAFQGIYNEEGFWMFETNYRLGGGIEYSYIEKLNGINYLKMMISYALTGDMGDDVTKNDPFFPSLCGRMDIHAHGGVVETCEYTGETDGHGVVSVVNFYSKGTVVPENGSTAQNAFSFTLNADSLEELKENVNYIQDHLIVTDTEGRSMLFKRFDTDRIVNERNING